MYFSGTAALDLRSSRDGCGSTQGSHNSPLRLHVHGTLTALVIWSSDMVSANQPKSVTLPDILTDAQIAHALRLYKAHGVDAVAKIQVEVVEPSMAAINAKLGQENSSRYLAYAVVYVFSEAEKLNA